MNEAVLGLLLGVASSVLTTFINAEYSLRRFRAEQDREDDRDERKYRRTQDEERRQQRLERATRDVIELEDFLRAAAQYHVLTDTADVEKEKIAEASLEFAKLAGAAYRYPSIAEPTNVFKNSPDYYDDLKAVIEATEVVIAERRKVIEVEATR